MMNVNESEKSQEIEIESRRRRLLEIVGLTCF